MRPGAHPDVAVCTQEVVGPCAVRIPEQRATFVVPRAEAVSAVISPHPPHQLPAVSFSTHWRAQYAFGEVGSHSRDSPSDWPQASAEHPAPFRLRLPSAPSARKAPVSMVVRFELVEFAMDLVTACGVPRRVAGPIECNPALPRGTRVRPEGSAVVDLEREAAIPAGIPACVRSKHTQCRIQSRIGPTLRCALPAPSAASGASVAEGAKER